MDRSRRHPAWLILVCAACTHSASFDYQPAKNGPFSAGPDVQLTFSGDQDYWPIWTQDGKGILYAFVDPQFPEHRCVGLLPAAGGTRIWQLCDTRASMADSATSFAAFALDSSGRLLLATAVAQRAHGLPPTVTLWLTDSASPFVRTPLLTLPVTFDTTVITWLADIAWTGPTTFIALGQQYQGIEHCVAYLVGPKDAVHCYSQDSLFGSSDGVVVRGTIADGLATLAPISGTDGATAYALADAGASVVMTKLHQPQLYVVPANGGVARPVLTVPRGAASEILGVTCRLSSCLYARDSLQPTGQSNNQFVFSAFFWPPGSPTTWDFTKPIGEMELHRVSLASGVDELLLRNPVPHTPYSTPQVSQVSGDVVVQVGGGWGHLQTFATRGTGDLFAPDGNSVLHLFKGMLP